MKNYTNPIIPNENTGKVSDPYVLKVGDYYYHCYDVGSRGAENGVYLACSKSLWDIGNGDTMRVYKATDGGVGCSWYAPELHHLGDAWYIYGAPQTDENGMHTMTVLENKSDNPMGEYTNLGMVKGLENTWCIDGTILEYKGEHYFIWAGDAELVMAKMENPYTVTKPYVSLSRPELPFETKTEIPVIEGPAILKRNGKIHIVYSANDSRDDSYCLGVLTYSGGDIMNPQNWAKRPEVSFEKTESIFGPGHCSFTTVTENGTDTDYIVYHANLTSGDNWQDRNVFIQSFTWDEEDMPIFGKPQF